jgi:hypothetical protein
MPEKKDGYQRGTQEDQPAVAQLATSTGGHNLPSQQSVDLLILLLQEFARRAPARNDGLPPEVAKDIALVTTVHDALKSAVKLANGPIVISKVDPKTGSKAGGMQTTIEGSRFVPGSKVRFGSRAATDVTFVSPTLIRATTPPSESAGAVDVVIESLAGSVSLPGGYTYDYAQTVK